MWDLPGPGIEPVSPALAGGFLTTEPPGKPPSSLSFLKTQNNFSMSALSILYVAIYLLLKQIFIENLLSKLRIHQSEFMPFYPPTNNIASIVTILQMGKQRLIEVHCLNSQPHGCLIVGTELASRSF